jgi:hypothetical protein
VSRSVCDGVIIGAIGIRWRGFAMADEATLKADATAAEQAAAAATDVNDAVAKGQTAVDINERLNGLTQRDWCRLAAAYQALAERLSRRDTGNDRDNARSFLEKAAEAYRKCGIQKRDGDTTTTPPVPKNPGEAAKAFRKESAAHLAEAAILDQQCEQGDTYREAAEALLRAAAAEPDPTEAVSELKHAAELFRKAAACYKNCGDFAIDDDPLDAHGSYHKEVEAYGAAERTEGVIEAYYKKREPADTPGIGGGPTTQHGKARKRKEEDARHRKEAGRREKAAKEKYLLLSLNPGAGGRGATNLG